VLPLITGATFLANVERGSEVPMDHETAAKQKTMKNVMRGLAALMVPLTASFPMAIFAYWIPSNIFTFLQVRCRFNPCD
jgi:YidC/Oxa1 family membrane protein insertase